jgi:hypothetical protein
MKWARVCLGGFLLAAALLVADKYYPFGPTNDDDEVYYAQNFQYVNPHLRMDGSYVPGYYLPSGRAVNSPRLNPTPDYFPVTENNALYSGRQPGSQYFAPGDPNSIAVTAGYWPYFYPIP